MYTSKILKALQESKINGFTTNISNYKLKRYIVALTHNEADVDVKTLNEQAENIRFKNINIGGWTDLESGKRYIDVSTSFDCLWTTLDLARQYKQIAIWDNLEQKEIRINY